MSNSKIQDGDGSAVALAKYSFWYDRGAVLFIGIAVGGVLGLSFNAEGKPFNFLFEDTEIAASVTATTAPVKAAEALERSCIENFPVAPRVIAALRSNAPIKVGVFGDSFGDGIWGAALAEFEQNPDFQVFRFSKAATGFTTYNTSDRLADARLKTAHQPVDVALISFGANDAQAIIVDGQVAPYMSEGWKKVIGGRALAFVQLLQNQGAAVAWVGLPGMRSPKFDAKAHSMNGFFHQLMCANQVAFLNPASATEGMNHRFSKDLVDSATGISFVARADDGIHMTLLGYRFIARPLFDRIEGLRSGRPTSINRAKTEKGAAI